MFHPEFATLTMSRDELQEFHRALLARYLIEGMLRHEQGLEEVDPPHIIARCEQLLGLTPEAAHALFHRTEDELWAYSWYAYTDEWAWFRAQQDINKETKRRTKRTTNHASTDRLIERKYREQFDAYVAEVDMQQDSTPARKRQRKGTK